MKIDIQTVNFSATDGLLKDLHQLLGKLERLDHRITGADVYLKMQNSQGTDTRKAEIKVYLPGTDLYADHEAESFYEALHRATEKVRLQLLRYKDMVREKR